MNSDKILKVALNALNDKKATDLSAIHVGELTVITEYFIIATANSSSHIRALADIVDEKLSEVGIEATHIEGRATGWILLDYNSVVIHIFNKETREFYGLDRMWNDGEHLELSEILDSEEEK